MPSITVENGSERVYVNYRLSEDAVQKQFLESGSLVREYQLSKPFREMSVNERQALLDFERRVPFPVVIQDRSIWLRLGKDDPALDHVYSDEEFGDLLNLWLEEYAKFQKAVVEEVDSLLSLDDSDLFDCLINRSEVKVRSKISIVYYEDSDAEFRYNTERVKVYCTALLERLKNYVDTDLREQLIHEISRIFSRETLEKGGRMQREDFPILSRIVSCDDLSRLKLVKFDYFAANLSISISANELFADVIDFVREVVRENIERSVASLSVSDLAELKWQDVNPWEREEFKFNDLARWQRILDALSELLSEERAELSRIKRTAASQLKKDWIDEAKRWISANGSEYLKGLLEQGYQYSLVYLRERTEQEFPGFEVVSTEDFENFDASPVDLPSKKALALKSQYPEGTIVNLTIEDDDQYETEWEAFVIKTPSYLRGEWFIYRLISAK